MRTDYDVIVIGGGPSGSTLANLVAREGVRTLVLERETFPRFKVGESLLPCDIPVMERLGVELAMGGRHMRKLGADFYEESSGRFAVYPFADALPGTLDHAWQVDRASFDLTLVEAAASRGAEVHQAELVSEVDFGEEGVEVRTNRASYRARYLVDASGQASVLAYRHGTRRRIDEFGLGAVFTHFEGLRPAVVDELAETGNVRILFVEDGWMWAIPLGQGRLGVGYVTRKKGVSPEWLPEAIAASPLLSRYLEGAVRPGPIHRIASFSFYNERTHGPRWTCVGDAACFLDPVFSSGVSFGMLCASHTADVLLPALAEGREAERGLMDGHAARMAHGYSVFATLIRSLYQRRLLPDLFFTIEQDPALRQGLTSVLAGDLWRDDNPFQRVLWASKRRRFELTPSVAATL
ncbi:MAG: NAD(P)/FAD-dependent oxidoreductase [Sandaracinaceae bacterium]